MNNGAYRYIDDFLHRLLEKVEPSLAKGAVEDILKELYVGETELGFEDLLLYVIELDYVPEVDLLECRRIGRMLGLDKETMIDTNFWQKFSDYVDKNPQSSK